MARTHYLAHDAIHHLWDTTHAPNLTIESGDTVVIHTRDVSNNQIGPASTAPLPPFPPFPPHGQEKQSVYRM